SYSAATHNVTALKAINYYAPGTTDTAGALINTELFFKRVAYIHEGMRWLDVLRLKLKVKHTYGDGTPADSLLAADPRRQCQLPQEVTQAGMQLNPR
ncbi:MAG: RagB/SusD family nutrient uptake outer membrane protein, partial [Bacteroidetes bacterium]|nr:RagB/SusD family nutrient uptake outer membrane protein [Bacteroidota bacterium]